MAGQSQHSSRREFLKLSGTALAGTALATNFSIARSAHAEGNDRIQIGLIGCGRRGSGAAMNCFRADKNIKLVAVADAFADNAQSGLKQMRKRYASQIDVPDERVFVGFGAYKKVLAAGIDLVLIATPPGFRPIHYQAAIDAGKHVFMEKPCCVDAPGYRSLVETSKQADTKGLKVGVGLQRHHETHYQDIVQRIHDGEIGEIPFMRVYWNSDGVWNLPRTPELTEMEYQMRNWYYFVWLSGDHIVEQHIHNIDIGNWVKQGHPIEAQGTGGREVRRFGPNGDFGHIFDHHTVEFTYADGTKMFSQCRHIPACWRNVSEHIHGTKGIAQCDGRIYALRGLDGKTIYRSRKKNRPYDQEHVDLIDAIRNNKPYNEGYRGAEASFTAILGRMASYSGNIVRWDEAAVGGPSEMPAKFSWDANPPVMPDENGSYEHAVPIPGRYKAYS